jgi:hypothetical protein
MSEEIFSMFVEILNAEFDKRKHPSKTPFDQFKDLLNENLNENPDVDDQPRRDDGQWTKGGGKGGKGSTTAGSDKKADPKYEPMTDDYVGKFTKDKYSKEIVDIVYSYGASAYSLNATARGVMGYESQELKDAVEVFRKEIDKNELPSTELYRFVKPPEIEERFGKNLLQKLNEVRITKSNDVIAEIIETIKNKKNIVYDNFVSTTRGKDVVYGDNEYIKFNIKVPAGTKGLPIENMVPMKSEKEVLLNIGTEMRIRDVKFNPTANDGNGRFEIDVEVKNSRKSN